MCQIFACKDLLYYAGMKNQKAKTKAVVAIGKIITAAKELAQAEVEYYNRKPRKSNPPKKRAVLGAGVGK